MNCCTPPEHTAPAPIPSLLSGNLAQQSRQAFGQRARDTGQGGQFLGSGFANFLDTAEMFEQGLFARRADAGDVVEQALSHPAVAQGGMVFQREAVCFVADALQQVQRTRVARQQRTVFLTGTEDLLITFGQPDDRHLQLQLVHGLHGDV